MTKIKSIINSHNHKILRCNDSTKTCICRNETICPFNGECLFKGVYKATIIKENETKEYYSSIGVYFKKRYAQHKNSFKSGNNSHTTLSK